MRPPRHRSLALPLFVAATTVCLPVALAQTAPPGPAAAVPWASVRKPTPWPETRVRDEVEACTIQRLARHERGQVAVRGYVDQQGRHCVFESFHSDASAPGLATDSWSRVASAVTAYRSGALRGLRTELARARRDQVHQLAAPDRHVHARPPDESMTVFFRVDERQITVTIELHLEQALVSTYTARRCPEHSNTVAATDAACRRVHGTEDEGTVRASTSAVLVLPSAQFTPGRP